MWREGSHGPLTSCFWAQRVQAAHGWNHGQAPGKEVWLVWGDGSSAYTLAEFDSYVRHGVAPVDPEAELDWEAPDGRWMIMPILIRSDHDAEREKPRQVA